MIAILSPAMRMHAIGEPPESEPVFIREAALLCQKLRTLPPHRLETALSVNAELAFHAHAAMQRFDGNAKGVAAVFGFYGLCYSALDPASFSDEQRQYMQQHLRIVSPFYGLLRPFDNMQPYRLEFKTKGVPDIPDLYDFWGGRICEALFGETDCVVSLCSRENEKAVLPHVKPSQKIVRCEFLIPYNGKLMMKPTQVKVARGKMARFIVENKIDRQEYLPAFDWDGYVFMPHRSHSGLLVFAKTP